MVPAPSAPSSICRGAPGTAKIASQKNRWTAPWRRAACSWGGDPSKIGIYGSSSGGYVAELLSMRPRDKRYNAIPLPEAPTIDATVAYVATRSPISDPYARFQNAERLKRESMIANHKTFFKPWETIFESNAQQILERKEAVALGPLLIMQGALDDNVLPAIQEKFAKTYK
jgi:acetyl esterase/lipase